MVLHDYVQQSGTQFTYSQSAIDLVQKYMDKFPRVFELLNASESNTIPVCDLGNTNNKDNQSGIEYLKKIRDWLQSLPQSKARRTSVETLQLSSHATKHVQHAVHATVSKIFHSFFLESMKNERTKQKNGNFFIDQFEL